jgi:acetylornithine/succinyldiaminopimelate/putrescine aminotransferase
LLTGNPVLGHITTFGGHPVCCAAGLAAMEVLLKSSLVNDVTEKEMRFREKLRHSRIRELRSFGLWMALEFESFELNKNVIDHCIARHDAALITDWFLFAPQCMRISPPLTISNEEIDLACQVILEALNQV